MSYTPPDPSTYVIPSAGSRAFWAGLYLVPSVLIYAVLPYYGLSELSRFGITTGYSLGVIAFAGIALAVIGAARSFGRPTRAYGPLSMLLSAATIVYLLYLARLATISLSFGSSAGFTLSYAGMLDALALVPAIRLVSGLVTTIEDFARPGQRLPFDYPAPVAVPTTA